MIPAEQSLEAGDLVALQIHHRLVVKLEFAGRQRLAQVLLHDAAGLHLLVHRGLEETERAAAVALGAVQRKVGVSEQLVGSIAVARADGNADAGADHRLLAVDVIGLADPCDDLLRERGRVSGIRDRSLDDDEFVAAHPGDGVGLAHQCAQAIGDDLEQLVAGGMTEGVVHRLELIEVEVMHGHHLLAVEVGEGLLEPFVQQHAVGEIGQRIVVGHVLDLDLGLALLGDVFMGGDPAEIGHRAMPDLVGLAVPQLDDAVLGFVGYRNVGAPAQIFVARHGRKASDFEAKVDDFRQRRAGADLAGRNVVHLDIAVVAHDQLVVGVEEAQALRHVVDRGVELEIAYPQRLFLLLAQLVLPLQAGMELLALGDVFMGCDAAAVEQRADGVGDDTSVGEFLDRGVERNVAPDPLADVFLGRHAHLQADVQPVLDQRAGRRTRFHLLGREPVHCHVAPVAENDPAVRVEDDNSERQIVDRLCEAGLQARRFRVRGWLVAICHTAVPVAIRGVPFVQRSPLQTRPGEMQL